MDESQEVSIPQHEKEAENKRSTEVWVFTHERHIAVARKKTLAGEALDDRQKRIIDGWNSAKEKLGAARALDILTGKADIKLLSPTEASNWIDANKSDVRHIIYTLMQPHSPHYQGERLTDDQKRVLDIWDTQVIGILGYHNARQKLETR